MESTLGTILNDYRKKHRLTLKEVSASMGVDTSYLSRIENDQRQPTDEQIKHLATLYNEDYKVLKRYSTIEKIVNLLAYADAPHDILMACEPRIEFLRRGKQSEQVFISDDASVGLIDIDDLKLELSNLEEPTGIRLSKMREHFNIEYTHESNKIEGNTLTLSETALVINEGITISGKSMQEHLEAINHSEAIEFLYDLVSKKTPFNEYNLLQIHNLVLRGIDSKNAGVYRNVNVRISGAKHIPPEPYLVPKMMEDYFFFYQANVNKLHPVILAAEMHERLVTIHPFIDGNGRTSRLVMNLILLMHGYPISILKGSHESRLKYFNALAKVQTDHDRSDFHELIIASVKNSLVEHIELTK